MTNNKFTYCNPLAIPDVPRGHYDIDKGDFVREYRCISDATVFYDEGVWYMYTTSSDKVYYTKDFINWQSHKLANELIGSAPAITKFRGKYYFSLNIEGFPLYVSDSPLGEFKCLGPVKTVSGEQVEIVDMAFFADDDNGLYVYWGCGTEEIYAAKLNSDNPTLVDGEIKTVIKFDNSNVWERQGAYNHGLYRGWTEGAHLYKNGDKYYLIYSSAGTEFTSYAMGVYVGDNPMGPFKYQDKNPLIRGTEGIVHGCGHGSVVDGPDNTIWIFYTSIISCFHKFERVVGMDRAHIDNEGNLVCGAPSSFPRFAPSCGENAGKDAGFLPLTAEEFPIVSSCLLGSEPIYITDQNPKSWWCPEFTDKNPEVKIILGNVYEVASARIIWKEVGLDYKKGITPKPVSYTIEGITKDGERVMLCDNSANDADMYIDYRELPKIACKEIILKFKKPEDYTLGITDFTVFGAAKEGLGDSTPTDYSPNYYSFK